MKWITRAHVKVDRIACAWLISRFVDPNAIFLFADEADLLEKAAAEWATPYDAPRLPAVALNHRPGKCSFDAFMEDYDLLRFNGLTELATLIRAADSVISIDADPRARALKALTDSLNALQVCDEARLEAGFPVFDALFEKCKL